VRLEERIDPLARAVTLKPRTVCIELSIVERAEMDE